MTIEQAKNRLVAWVTAQIGTREGANNWNKYAEDLRLQQLYGWNAQNQPWCDLFTDAAFINCFGISAAAAMTYQPIGAGSAACRYSAQFFKNAGAWYDTPEIGDVIFFFDSGQINHQGVVVSVGNGLVATVEGNSSDMVARRSYSIGAGNIAGYGRPKWSVVADMDPDAAEDETPADQPADGPVAPAAPSFSYCAYKYAVRVNLLKKGCYGPQVANMQRLLRDHGFDPGEIDGVFGANTYEALMAFQTAAGITVDGEWGGESFNAMWNY